MKRWLTVLAVLLLLLTGCTEEVPQETQVPTTVATAAPTEPDPGLYDPNHSITQQTGGAIAAYPLEGNGHSLYPMGEKRLLIRFEEKEARLTLLSGETCVREVETVLSPVQFLSHIWVGDSKIAWYDQTANEIVMLDGKLREVERIPMPKEELRSLTLDAGLTTVYYTAEDRICAFDLQTGVSRLLRHMDGREPYVGVIQNDTVLSCWYWLDNGDVVEEYISCQDGRTYYTGSDIHTMSYLDETWIARHTDGPVQEYLYGDDTGTWVFQPVAEARLLYFAGLSDGNIVAVHEQEYGTVILELYDMQRKTRTASVTVQGILGTGSMYQTDAGIWFVAHDAKGGDDTLCCWNPELTPAEPADCLFTWYNEENPDTQGLAACAAYAQTIGDTYGITVTLGLPDALKADYAAKEEYYVSVIQAALEDLEFVLSQFNENYYMRVKRVTESRSFTISLVRGITAANGEPLPDGNGLQTWVAGDSYIVVPVGTDTRSQLYHQLWHMTETYVLNRNSVLDTWDRLNPEGFAYLESYSYAEEQLTASYLSGPLQAFIDAHSMTYPREDRARIMEYAMLEGNGGYFESDTMQAKLNSLCWSIRRAFKWEESKEVFPWEQYLKEPPKE